jgi:hypothetical protein
MLGCTRNARKPFTATRCSDESTEGVRAANGFPRSDWRRLHKSPQMNFRELPLCEVRSDARVLRSSNVPGTDSKLRPYRPPIRLFENRFTTEEAPLFSLSPFPQKILSGPMPARKLIFSEVSTWLAINGSAHASVPAKFDLHRKCIILICLTGELFGAADVAHGGFGVGVAEELLDYE